MTVPRHGRRGEPYALDRDRRYRREHDDSARQAETPRTWNALRHWFVDEWQAALPTRSHVKGVEDSGPDGGLGSPRMAPALRARTAHASDRGWGLTGWDRDGQPIGVDGEGHTTQPFLYHLERMMRDGGTTGVGARALVTWAYMGFDVGAAARETFRRTSTPWESAALEALLERTVRDLHRRCLSEPVRWSVCRVCRRRECICAQKSESQVNAEGET